MAVIDRQLTRRRSAEQIPCGYDEAFLAGWPGLRRTAEILGVTPSTLSRREIRVVERGRERAVPPSEVMRLAAYYRRRPIEAVAADLVGSALEQAPADVVEGIELELERCLASLRAPSGEPGADVVETARRVLSPEAFARVEAVAREELAAHPGIRGKRPHDE